MQVLKEEKEEAGHVIAKKDRETAKSSGTSSTPSFLHSTGAENDPGAAAPFIPSFVSPVGNDDKVKELKATILAKDALLLMKDQEIQELREEIKELGVEKNLETDLLRGCIEDKLQEILILQGELEMERKKKKTTIDQAADFSFNPPYRSTMTRPEASNETDIREKSMEISAPVSTRNF